MKKRGLYKHDLGYVLSYNVQMEMLQLLVASQELKDLEREMREGYLRMHSHDPSTAPSIGIDPRACQLFNPSMTWQPASTSCLESCGRTSYKYNGKTYMHGLLLMSLHKENIIHVATPSPQEISLHRELGCHLSFVTGTLQSYNARFWRENDRVRVNDGTTNGGLAELHSIDLEC